MNLETADENKMDSIGSKIDPKNYFLPQSHLRHNLYNLLQVKQILFPEKRLFIPHYSQNRGRRETCSFLRGCILASTFSSSSKSFCFQKMRLGRFSPLQRPPHPPPVVSTTPKRSEEEVPREITIFFLLTKQ